MITNDGDKTVIDLSQLGGRVYVGRQNGNLARKHFRIDELENENNYPITVIFPGDAKTMTSSFFLGMFGKSVLKSKSMNNFLGKFKFQTNNEILQEINDSINEALLAE